MKFVAISDTHNRHTHLKLPKADAIIHAGDVTYRGKVSEVTDFLKWFSGLNYQYKIFIAGNHDFYFEKTDPVSIGTLIPEGIIYLKDSGTEINGVRIWGSPFTPWFFSWAFNRHRGEPMRKQWSLIPPQTDLLITHGPPFGILDLVRNQIHAGCNDLLKRIEEIKPKVHVFGHIHESHGIVRKNGIRYINASVMNDAYDLVYRPVTFEL